MVVDWDPVLKMEPLKPPEPLPFVCPAEGADAAKGLFPPAVKLKPVVGGWGLKLVFVLLPPNAGNEELEKVLAG